MKNGIVLLEYRGKAPKGNQVYLLVLLLFILNNSLCAQVTQPNEQSKPEVIFNGSLSLSSEFYNASGIEARMPGNTERMIFRSNVTLFNQIQLPFEIYLTSQQTKFQQPFSQFGVNPQITDWLLLHAGYFSAQISDLSFGDVRILGGGIELHPGLFRVKAFYGRSRRAAESDTLQFFYGCYKQNLWAAQIGYGNEGSYFINLNILHTEDDTNSITRNAYTPTANENLVTSVGFGLKPIDELTMTGEVALGLFTNDLSADNLTTNKVKLPSFLFTLKNSSQVDGAAKLFIILTPDRYWNLRLGATWVGPGFVTMGYSQLPNDFVEYIAAPSVSLLDRKLNLRGSIGIRNNNLRNNRAATTGRFTGTFSADYQITNPFGFNLQYNNNSVKTSRNNDTLKTSNIFNSFMLSPRYSFQEFGGMNNLVLNYSYQISNDKIAYITNSVKNKTNTVNLLHTLFLPSTLSFSTSVLFNKVDVPALTIMMYNITETVGHLFLDNLLNCSICLGYSITKTTFQNNIVLIRITSGYSLGKWGNVNLNLSNNHVGSGDNINPGYTEFQGMLQYDINF